MWPGGSTNLVTSSVSLKSKIMKKTLVGFCLVLLVTVQVIAQKEVDPLQAAIAAKNLALLKEVIANGGKVNQTFEFTAINPKSVGGIFTYEKGTPLLYALSFEWYDGVLELLRAGAKPNASTTATASGYSMGTCPVKDFDGISPMHLAVMMSDIDLVKLLIISGGETKGFMNVNFKQKCKLVNQEIKFVMWHMRQNSTDTIKELLKEGKKAPWAAKGLPAEGQRPQ
jgi:ankyrin repeat protein